MQALFELTEGLDRLKRIIASFPPDSPHWNEAENRFQYVDRLLTECLGWERPNIRGEVLDELGGKADYVLGQPTKAVLEAKREAKYFDSLPTGKPTAVRRLEPMLAASKSLEEAVHQILPILHNAGGACCYRLQRSSTCDVSGLDPRFSSLGGGVLFFQRL
jgi:hypothetical protein